MNLGTVQFQKVHIPNSYNTRLQAKILITYSQAIHLSNLRTYIMLDHKWND